MKPEIFADGFTSVTFRNGMVRMELGSLPMTEGEGQAKLDGHHRLVLTPQGFLQGLSLMQDLARRLADAGVLRKADADAAAGGAAPATNSGGDASDQLP